MSRFKLFLFGKFHIEINDKPIQKMELRKAEELLVYLLLSRDQPQSREHLADLLWREIAAEQSKSYLRKSLWQLQSFLYECGSQDLLLVDGEWLQVNPDFDFWLDIDMLERSFKDTRGIKGRDLGKEQAANIKDVVNIYQGDLLEGWYQEWCLYERERLRFLYLALLDKLMDHCEAQEDYENGLLFGERILHYDRARERTHRRLMRMHCLAGDRTAALRQYQKCVTVLKAELDVDPADRTRQLYEMIRADELQTPLALNNVGKIQSREVEERLHMLFSHLSSLHKSLSKIQTQITQDIQAIEKTIQKNSF